MNSGRRATTSDMNNIEFLRTQNWWMSFNIWCRRSCCEAVCTCCSIYGWQWHHSVSNKKWLHVGGILVAAVRRREIM